MLPLRKPIALALTCVLLAASAPVTALTSDQVVNRTDIERALQRRSQADVQRATILGLLQRPEVRSVAAESGLDLKRAESAVGVLQGDELSRLARQAAEADRALAGGDHTIHMSTVTLLLLIIIIILLVD